MTSLRKTFSQHRPDQLPLHPERNMKAEREKEAGDHGGDQANGEAFILLRV